MSTDAGRPAGQCTVADTFRRERLLVCDPHTKTKPPQLRLKRPGEAATVLVGSAEPVQHGQTPSGRAVSTYDGRWDGGFFSPSGEWVLAQWSGACETPAAYVINVAARTLVPAGGKPAELIGLGWTRSNLAVVYAPQAACGTAFSAPGVYLIQPETQATQRLLEVAGFSAMWGG